MVFLGALEAFERAFGLSFPASSAANSLFLNLKIPCYRFVSFPRFFGEVS
jgi:hypothetical protein